MVLTDLGKRIYRMERTIDRLSRENAKLEERVEMLYSWIQHHESKFQSKIVAEEIA